MKISMGFLGNTEIKYIMMIHNEFDWILTIYEVLFKSQGYNTLGFVLIQIKLSHKSTLFLDSSIYFLSYIVVNRLLPNSLKINIFQLSSHYGIVAYFLLPLVTYSIICVQLACRESGYNTISISTNYRDSFKFKCFNKHQNLHLAAYCYP